MLWAIQLNHLWQCPLPRFSLGAMDVDSDLVKRKFAELKERRKAANWLAVLLQLPQPQPQPQPRPPGSLANT